MIKNVQNPVEYYKNHTISYGSASWIWRCKNPRCRVRFPFWSQKKFDQMFDQKIDQIWNDLTEGNFASNPPSPTPSRKFFKNKKFEKIILIKYPSFNWDE